MGCCGMGRVVFDTSAGRKSGRACPVYFVRALGPCSPGRMLLAFCVGAVTCSPTIALASPHLHSGTLLVSSFPFRAHRLAVVPCTREKTPAESLGQIRT